MHHTPAPAGIGHRARAWRARAPLLACALAGLALASGAGAQDVPRSQFVVVGDVDSLLVGRDGYCGPMEKVGKEDLRRMSLPSGTRIWVRHVQGGAFSGTCALDFSFVPEAGRAYIARYATVGRVCQVELFRIRPGLDPVRSLMTEEKSRPCLVP